MENGHKNGPENGQIMENGHAQSDSSLEQFQIAQRDRMNAAGMSGNKTKLMEHYKDIAKRYDEVGSNQGRKFNKNNLLGGQFLIFLPKYLKKIINWVGSLNFLSALT